MLDYKARFVNQSLSRCVADMIPEVARLEYRIQDLDEAVLIRLQNGETRQVDVTGLDLQQTTQAVLERLEECA